MLLLRRICNEIFFAYLKPSMSPDQCLDAGQVMAIVLTGHCCILLLNPGQGFGHVTVKSVHQTDV